MNLADKKTLNLLRYGTPNPGLLKRMGLVKSIPFYEVLKDSQNGLQYWTKEFSASAATKGEMVSSGYNKNVMVYSIITKISRVAAQAPWGVYKVVNKKSYAKYKAISSQSYSDEQYFNAKKLKFEALEPMDNHFLNGVFQNPNEQQSGSEYMENLLGFKLLTGDAYEWGNMLKRGEPGELWVLPSQFIEIKNNGAFPMRETGYQLSYGGGILDLSKESVMHSKYWNPNWNVNGDHLYGFSPLDAAWLSVLGDNTARGAAYELLMNRGQRGIFTIESDAIKDYSTFIQMKSAIKEEWSQNTKEYKDKITPMFGKGQWHAVGLSPKDLAILEICGLNKDDLCNAFLVSSILFNNHVASTRDNYITAEKDMITSAVLPLLNSVRDGRNRKLDKVKGDWNRNQEDIVVDYDQTVYTQLEKNKESIVKWMKEAGCFSDNEIRVQLNFEESKDKLASEVWKKTNEVPMSMVNEKTLTANNTSKNG